MVKVRFRIPAAIGLFALVFGMAYADESHVVKLVVDGKPRMYGTLDGDAFTACNGIKMNKPAGATFVPVAGGCPSESSDFVPHSGHFPKAKPSPKPKHTR